MTEYERRYQDGETIFEGGGDLNAFEVVEGRINLTARTEKGPVRLGMLMPGEIFDEAGIAGTPVHQLMAVASGPVTVRFTMGKTPANDEPGAVQASEGAEIDALPKDSGLVAVSGAVRAAPAKLPIPIPKIGLFDRIRDFAETWGPLQKVFAGWNPALTILRELERSLDYRVVRLSNDKSGKQTALVIAALSAGRRIRARQINEAIRRDPDDTVGVQFRTMVHSFRRMLLRENADLLIWGEVSKDERTVYVHFIPAADNGDHPGRFLATDTLALPADFSPEFGRLLRAVSIAATIPRTAADRQRIGAMLPPALEAAQISGHRPQAELSVADQATLQVCYGNVAALLGYQRNDPNWYRSAAMAYRGSLEALNRDADPLSWATAQRHLGIVLHAMGEKSNDPEILMSAVSAYRAAAEIFGRDEFPGEWASLQQRLGMAFYKLDVIDSDTEILKQSIGAYQNALQVFTRAQAPQRWGEIKDGLGQALQVWGDIARNEELLERAVASCRDALAIRSRDQMPLLWAASQNNLGSALFLLGRMTNQTEHLEGAVEAFRRALSVYDAEDAEGLANVTGKNLAKAEDLLKGRASQGVHADRYGANDAGPTLRSTKRVSTGGR